MSIRGRLLKTSLDPRSIQQCLDEKQHTNIALHLYSELRKSALEIENPEFAREAGYQYHRWSRYHLRYKCKSGEVSNVKFAQQWLFSIGLDYVIGYGWRVHRFAISTALMVVALTFWNYFIWSHLVSSTYGTSEPTFVASLYYTMITITTLGYGDITPVTTLGMLSAVAQATLGVLWIGLLVSVIVRKVLP